MWRCIRARSTYLGTAKGTWDGADKLVFTADLRRFGPDGVSDSAIPDPPPTTVTLLVGGQPSGQIVELVLAHSEFSAALTARIARDALLAYDRAGAAWRLRLAHADVKVPQT